LLLLACLSLLCYNRAPKQAPSSSVCSPHVTVLTQNYGKNNDKKLSQNLSTCTQIVFVDKITEND
jgi:hypothetical protein